MPGRFGFHARRGYFRPARRLFYRSDVVALRRTFALASALALAIWGLLFFGAGARSGFFPSNILTNIFTNIMMETVGQIAREGARLGPAVGGWLDMDPERAKVILQQTLPVPAEADLETPPELSWQNRLRFWLYMALDYDITRPETLLAAALPHPAPVDAVVRLADGRATAGGSALADGVPQSNPPESARAGGNQVAPTVSVKHAENAELARLQQEDWGAKPLVLIYHTHTSEMYKPSYPGVKAEPHVYNTTDTGIVRAGEALARTLSERYGIPVVHSKAVHDFPSFAHAYTNSAKTVRDLIAKYPSIKVVIDVHRDAAENVSFVRNINGVQAAQVMIVVSKLGETKPALHPRWRDNMRFAAQMEAAMQQLYPGMLRRYPPVTARYNQQLHPNMVLLEIGNYQDAEVYALRSAVMMADVVAVMVDKVKNAPVRSVAVVEETKQPVAAPRARAVQPPSIRRPAPGKARP